jgi:hypothetical protein
VRRGLRVHLPRILRHVPGHRAGPPNPGAAPALPLHVRPSAPFRSQVWSQMSTQPLVELYGGCMMVLKVSPPSMGAGADDELRGAVPRAGAPCRAPLPRSEARC